MQFSSLRDRFVTLGITAARTVMGVSKPGTIFISYRRNDHPPGFATRLYERLKEAFPKNMLFIDVARMYGGDDIEEEIQKSMELSDVVLAVIGKNWVTAVDGGGKQRIAKAKDYVRLEIKLALQLKRRIIPVLANDTSMVSAENLPLVLKPLARRNAVSVTEERFHDDTESLIQTIVDALRDASERRRSATRDTRKLERFIRGASRFAWLLGRNNRRAPWLIVLLVLINALLLRAIDPSELSQLRDFAFDNFQRLKPRAYYPETPVRIVDIDDGSLNKYGQWPWPRSMMARLIDKLTDKGAAAIAFDVLFSEPDRLKSDNDQVMATAMANSRVVLGFAFSFKAGVSPPRRDYGFAYAGDDPGQFLPMQRGTVKPIPILEAAAKGIGSLNIDFSRAVTRSAPLLFRSVDQSGLYTALSIEALRVAQGARGYVVKSSGASDELSFGVKTGIVSIRTGDLQASTDRRGHLLLYDTGYREERYISAIDILEDKVSPDKIDGRVIFVGSSATGLKDIVSTPVADSLPGIEFHAQLAEQIIEQQFLLRPDFADGAEWLYLATIGLLLSLLLRWLRAGWMAIVAALFVAVGIIVPWIAFSRFNLLFDPIYPPVTLAAIYVSGSAAAFIRMERERAAIRGAFGFTLSPDVVEQLVRNPTLVQLGGEMREITVMFTDIRGFTLISEQFDPHGLTRFMNRYLTPMTDIILNHRGTIDKYIGDAIMAFWNAPLQVEGHAALACDTAIAMQARLMELDREWQAEAEAEGREYNAVNIGIGINTGQASIGNFGSMQRFAYSCLGKEVNVASRLQTQCKTYGVGIIIGNKTRLQMPDYATLELDLVAVKGKTEPEPIHALLGGIGTASKSQYQRLAHLQSAFVRDYRAGNFAKALEMIDACQNAAAAAGWEQGYYEMMRARIAGLINDPPAGWTGVHVSK